VGPLHQGIVVAPGKKSRGVAFAEGEVEAVIFVREKFAQRQRHGKRHPFARPPFAKQTSSPARDRSRKTLPPPHFSRHRAVFRPSRNRFAGKPFEQVNDGR
jgi:hypothetical protein